MMLLPSCRRGLIPACLTFGTLLCALPILADPPAVPPVSAARPQILQLQHVVPGDLVKLLHWDQPASLPDGVTQVQSLPAQNALIVTATPAGLAGVRQFVKIIDINPSQVQMKFVLTHLSEAALKASGIEFDIVPSVSSTGPKLEYIRYATGRVVERYKQALVKQGKTEWVPEITTTNNVSAAFTVTTQLPHGLLNATRLSVTPRVNADDSVTLALHPVFTVGTSTQDLSTLRTLKSEDTMVLVTAPSTEHESVLLFVTPTVKN